MKEELKNLDNRDKYFKGQHINEELECFYRHHWIVLVPPVLLYIVFIVLFGLFLILMREQNAIQKDGVLFYAVILSGFLFATYYVHRFFVHMYNFFLNIVIITNYRIVDLDKTLILHDTREVIDIAKIQDVTKKQDGLVRNILNYGQLIITLSSVSSTKTLHFVPNPDFHFRVINRKKREYIQQKQSERTREFSGIEPKFPVKDVSPYSGENVYVE